MNSILQKLDEMKQRRESHPIIDYEKCDPRISNFIKSIHYARAEYEHELLEKALRLAIEALTRVPCKHYDFSGLDYTKEFVEEVLEEIEALFEEKK